MRIFRTGLVLAALLNLSGLANAGLIQFYYQVSGTVYPTTNSPSPGQVEVVPAQGGAISSDPNNSIVLSQAVLSGWQYATPPTINSASVTFFNVVVNLTDAASGQSGTIGFHGDAGVQWAKQIDGSFAIVSASIVAAPNAASSLFLGSNRYTVQMGYVPADQYVLDNLSQAQPLSVPIHLSIDPVVAPEPCSLLLAAGGLPLLGVFVRRNIKKRL